MKAHGKRAGFTLVEIAVAMAIIAAVAALAIPSMHQWSANQRLVSSTRTVDGVLSYARGEAIRTGDIHLVFIGVDTQDNPLTGPSGESAAMIVVNDGRPGSANQNCLIDAGEVVFGVNLERDVSWGVNNASGPVSSDPGSAAITGPSTFEDAGGNPAQWVGFRSEGTPLAFSSDCTVGGVGSGGGGVYLSNGERDKAVVMNPLGGTRIHSWVPGGGWSS